MWFQTMLFSWIPMIISLSFIIYWVTISQAVFGISRLNTYILLVIIFSSRSEQRKTVLCLFLCLINKSSLCNSFFYNSTYTRAVMFHVSRRDSGDSRKWIMASLNRLVQWKVVFQSLIVKKQEAVVTRKVT